MSEPASKEEFEAKFEKNTAYYGKYLGTGMKMPCPFCAEPDFLVYLIIEVNEKLKEGAVCKHCQRGCKGIVVENPGSISFRMVQTSGDDPSPWAKMDRE
jgi:hypothetical protein